MSYALPEALQPFLSITEVDHSTPFGQKIFRRKYRQDPPDFEKHLVCFFQDNYGAYHVAGYSHMTPHGNVYLSGGSCTDGDVIRLMSEKQRELVSANGGILHHILKYAFDKYAGHCRAFFGHCGDARAWEVVMAVGFVPTEHQYLIAHWHQPIDDAEKAALVAKINAIGAF